MIPPYPEHASLPGHARYPYLALPERRVWSWPNGARLAVYIALNVEVFPFGEGHGVPLANPLPQPDVLNFSWRDWGNRVGIWYLLQALERHDLPVTALVNTAIFDMCPPVGLALKKIGAEFVAHGRTNAERQSDMDPAYESAMIHACRDRIQAETGKRPAGWMGPWVSETASTPDLLAQAGFDYVMDWAHDDQPTRLRTCGPDDLISVPYARPVNDLPMLHGAKWTPREWVEALTDQFDEMLDLSRHWPLVFNLSLHPFLTGWPFRLRPMHDLLARLHASADAGEIWLCTAGEIARHARTVLPPDRA